VSQILLSFSTQTPCLFRWLYWNDQGNGLIGKCRPDGSDITITKGDEIKWPNQMVYSRDASSP
jgi:hypothetical protein